MYGLFDTHAHYDDSRFDGIRDELLDGMTSPDQICPCGVQYIMNVGCKLESSQKSIELAEKYDFVYAAAGFHPHETSDMPDNWQDELIRLLSHPKVRAIGEIGLDFHYDFAPRDRQQEIFEQQLILSEQTGYPVLVHDREAHGHTMDIISRHKAIGVMHSFSGSGEMAKELIRRGWYVSYSGSVTFKNAVNLTETVKYVPDDRLLVETDAPFLAPVPYRGQTNNSHLAYATAQKLADIRQVDVSHIIEITNKNAKRLFGIE